MGDQKMMVSIGMPVYNEERYLARSLKSLLSQDFSDFELIISDNGSTDSTPDICRDYASRDSRIRYYRNDVNLGLPANFNRVFKLSRGKYFMWAAADDLWDPAFLCRCLEILRSDASVVLTYAQTVLTDDQGRRHGIMPGRLDTRDYDPISRFNLSMWGYIFGNHIYGLIKSSALQSTRLFRSVVGADKILLAELSLIGAFAYIPEPLFYRRRIREDETMVQRHKRYLEVTDPSNKKRNIFFPEVRNLYEYLNVALHASLPVVKRLALVTNALTGFIAKYGIRCLKPKIITWK